MCSSKISRFYSNKKKKKTFSALIDAPNLPKSLVFKKKKI